MVRRSRAFAFVAWLSRPVRRLLDLSYVYHLDLSGPLPEVRAEIPIELVRATREDVVEAAAIANPGLRDKFLARLDDGMACFVAKVDGRVVSYNWTRYRSGEDEGDVLELGPGEIYTTDAFTADGYRGLRIHSETLSYMLHTAKAEGYREAYTMASVLKLGSRKGLPPVGWRLSGRVIRLHLGRRFVVLRLSGSSRPLRAAAA